MFLLLILLAFYFIIRAILNKEYHEYEAKILEELGFWDWDSPTYCDASIMAPSYQALEQYTEESFFDNNPERLTEADKLVNRKNHVAQRMRDYIEDSRHKKEFFYPRLRKRILAILENSNTYKIRVAYTTPQGQWHGEKIISVCQKNITDRLFEKEYKKLEAAVLKTLGRSTWYIVPYYDAYITVKSRQALDNYDFIRFFKENKEKFEEAEETIAQYGELSKKLNHFLRYNPYTAEALYPHIKQKIDTILAGASAYRIYVEYISSANKHLGNKAVTITQNDLDILHQDPSLLIGKGEYNKLLKEQQKEALSLKQHEYYERVNSVIDYANRYKDTLVLKDGQDQVDKLIGQLFDRTVNSIKKVKSIDSEEWDIIGAMISRLHGEIIRIVQKNQKILEYYNSPDFAKIKETCESLMNSQREFNDYIAEKVESISKLFGTRVVRSETVHDDEYNYIRPYKKTITPFTAEVSNAVFSSAENNPLEYIVKHFYPNKNTYRDQIQRLYLLVQELETLKDAKQIIENYKAEYQQYLGDVPNFIIEHDEAGFYARLGFANIDESIFAVEYKFSYTSGGGMVQRSFTVPMTLETISDLIELLKSKLTAEAFAKEQRALMTNKLREAIKKRDNYTCCFCGNSVYLEPNLLLEIDHITPVAQGGPTEESNLQTLCWKCNRSKGAKII